MTVLLIILGVIVNKGFYLKSKLALLNKKNLYWIKGKKSLRNPISYNGNSFCEAKKIFFFLNTSYCLQP